MSLATGVKDVVRKVTGRQMPRLLRVKSARFLTPNMIRVTFAGPELSGFPEGREGGNCKLLLPEPDETHDDFEKRLSEGSSLVKRTYTVRHYRSDVQELDIDFVAHGDNGPASRWATHAKPGDFLGFAGPSQPKVTAFHADWFLVAADPSALPIAAATLEAMPRNAKGVAVFEVNSLEDTQDIDAPEGVEMHWLVHANPSMPSTQQEDFIRNMDWPEGQVQTCIAGESSVIRNLRAFLHREKQLPRSDTYISGYWKIGLVEDEHQAAKRSEG
ncbi:siderophore-interacting protein [Sulfitobacter sp. SK012]|uniref:siderophore-interacting protein n=1 Tax=Sulfitobacter sp. SK012 TaxID=1389005 RepID=UPI000E0C87B3|nr:siderophore-interacting protein [Sulfitobacter sp. SK012]AXI48519.1 siderophore-interacting protein [Sulfitobacter sp. SK012]